MSPTTSPPMPMPNASGPGSLGRVLTAIDAGVVIRGPDRRVREINPAACALFGVSSDVAMGTTLELAQPNMMDADGRAIPVEGSPEHVAFVERRAAGPLLLGLRRSHGRSPVWVRLTAHPLELDDGIGTLATLENVTDQEWMSRANTAQAEVLATFVHGDLDVVVGRVATCVGAIDPTRWALASTSRADGTRVLAASDGVPDAVVSVLRAADLAALPARDDAAPTAIHPEIGERLAAAGVGRLSVHVGVIDDVPVSWLFLGGPGRPGGGDGLAAHLPSLGRLLRLAAERDLAMTEIEAARSRAERAASDLMELFDALPFGIVQLDPDAVVEYANPALLRLYGHERDELVGHPTPTPPSEALPWVELAWGRAMAGRSTMGHQTIRHHRDGTPLSVRISYIPICDEGGATTAVIGIHEDVSERAFLERQLRQSQKMEAVGQLAGGVAHDFNNLLTVIGGNLELVIATLDDDASGQPFLEEIREATARAGGIASQLLAVAKPRVQRSERFDAGALVAKLQTLLKRMVGESTPLVVAESADCWVEGDPSQLEQVVLNLVLNARDASPDGSPIRVQVTAYGPPTARWVRVQVTDTGTGMDATTRDRAFEPFFTTKGRAHGTGLGLAISYGIVADWGGCIAIHSEPGQGTVVDVDLPAAPAEAPAVPAAPPREEPSTHDHDALAVLLVEDELSLRVLVERILLAEGFEVGAGSTLDDALAALPPGLRPDVLVTDVVLRGERGPDVAARLQATDPGLPVLYISGYGGGDDGRTPLPPGAAFLPKPFGGAELVGRILELSLTSRTGPGHG